MKIRLYRVLYCSLMYPVLEQTPKIAASKAPLRHRLEGSCAVQQQLIFLTFKIHFHMLI